MTINYVNKSNITISDDKFFKVCTVYLRLQNGNKIRNIKTLQTPTSHKSIENKTKLIGESHHHQHYHHHRTIAHTYIHIHTSETINSVFYGRCAAHTKSSIMPIVDTF